VYLKKSLLITTLFIQLYGCQPLQPNDNYPEEDLGKCYWMENFSGEYQWIAVEGNLSDTVQGISKKSCFALDSCNGGLGQSGGGCYKWALSNDKMPEPW